MMKPMTKKLLLGIPTVTLSAVLACSVAGCGGSAPSGSAGSSGGYNPTLNLCVAICKALRVTLNDLFWEDEIDVDPNAL